MPAIIYGRGAYRRNRGALPEFTLVNMFLEATPSAEAGVVLLSRPGLLTSTTAGTGPVTGVFSEEGTFGGDLFRVSGGVLYRGTTMLGTVVGTGPVSFASSGFELLVTAGTTLYSYNGTDFQAVVLSDDFDARAVTFISGHFIAIRDGSHKFYWSAQLDGRSWDALDFASAESEPDNLLDCVAMRGNLYLLGAGSIEPWYYTGDLNLPFTLIQQRLFPKGVVATGCAVAIDNALLWVGGDKIVYRTADVPERISDHGIEERITDSASVSCFGFVWEGHSFFCVRLDAATFGIDLATGQWCEFQSYGRDNFRGQCATTQAAIVYFGDDETGDVRIFGPDYSDDGETLTREFTGAFPIKGGGVTVDNLTLEINGGQTEYLAGQGSDPIIEMAASRDAGMTWGAFRPASLGEQGKYRTRTRWNRCGQFDSPGAMFKFRISDPVPVRVSNVLVNEAGGGRSRGG